MFVNYGLKNYLITLYIDEPASSVTMLFFFNMLDSIIKTVNGSVRIINDRLLANFVDELFVNSYVLLFILAMIIRCGFPGF